MFSDEGSAYLLEASESDIDFQTYKEKCETHTSLKLSFGPVSSLDVEFKELEEGFLDPPILGQSGEEMFIVGSKDKDQRKVLGKSERKKYIGHLVSKFPKNSYGQSSTIGGSACLVLHEGVFILLTCAHNVCQTFKGGRIEAKKVTFYRGRYGDEWLTRHQASRIVVHPHYYEVFELNGKHNMFDGVDIAICFLKWDEQLEKLKSKWEMDDNLPRLWTPPKKSYDFDNNMEINVTGYPGESKYPMHQYSMDGNAEIQRSQTKELEGHILTYKDLDTTKGQSGAPVISDNKIVGVHTGCSEKDVLNIATFITFDMLTWIEKAVAKHKSGNQLKKSPGEMVETKAKHSSLNMEAGKQVEKSHEVDVRGESTTMSNCCLLL